jgi:hypothetical protein
VESVGSRQDYRLGYKGSSQHSRSSGISASKQPRSRLHLRPTQITLAQTLLDLRPAPRSIPEKTKDQAATPPTPAAADPDNLPSSTLLILKTLYLSQYYLSQYYTIEALINSCRCNTLKFKYVKHDATTHEQSHVQTLDLQELTKTQVQRPDLPQIQVAVAPIKTCYSNLHRHVDIDSDPDACTAAQAEQQKITIRARCRQTPTQPTNRPETQPTPSTPSDLNPDTCSERRQRVKSTQWQDEAGTRSIDAKKSPRRPHCSNTPVTSSPRPMTSNPSIPEVHKEVGPPSSTQSASTRSSPTALTTYAGNTRHHTPQLTNACPGTTPTQPRRPRLQHSAESPRSDPSPESEPSSRILERHQNVSNQERHQNVSNQERHQSTGKFLNHLSFLHIFLEKNKNNIRIKITTNTLCTPSKQCVDSCSSYRLAQLTIKVKHLNKTCKHLRSKE